MAKYCHVFVYGTLKRGEPNHNWFYRAENGTVNFLGEAWTKEKYPLIIATKYNIPFLLHHPGEGHNVRGELYKVDEVTLGNLDILEDHPNFYIREEQPVAMLNNSETYTTAWIYFLKNFKPELLKNQMFESYSNKGEHGLRYAERYLRGDDSNYKQTVCEINK